MADHEFIQFNPEFQQGQTPSSGVFPDAQQQTDGLFSLEPPQPDVEDDLSKGKVEVLSRSWGSSNTAWLVEFNGRTRGIFKPGAGERELWDVPEAAHQLYKRERAAYLVSQYLPHGLIPPTVLREIHGYEGSVQAFLEAQPLRYTVDPDSHWADQLYTLSLLDYLIWNKDRKEEHFLVGSLNGGCDVLNGIDNGLSFDEWEGTWIIERRLQQYTLDREAPASVLEALAGFSRSGKPKELKSLLQELIPEKAIDALIARMSLVEAVFRQRPYITYHDLMEPNANKRNHTGNDLCYYPKSSKKMFS